jgi:hypothetical protein
VRRCPRAASAERTGAMHHNDSFFGNPLNWVLISFILFFILFV